MGTEKELILFQIMPFYFYEPYYYDFHFFLYIIFSISKFQILTQPRPVLAVTTGRHLRERPM